MRKGVTVWLFSTLTFVTLVHVIDAMHALIFSSQGMLFQLYPLPTEKLQTMTSTTYFWVSATATFVLWGITCAVAFDNPVETFLNKILTGAKKQNAVEAQVLDEKSELLDAMNETIGMNNTLLAHVRDMIYNVRTEVKEIPPLREEIEILKAALDHMDKEIKKFKENTEHPNQCPTCRKPILPEFKVCPYCGQNIKRISETLIELKNYT